MRKLCILLLIFCSNQLFAQVSKQVAAPQVSQQPPGLPDVGTTISNPVPASPDAASLGKYGSIPVSPYTGIPNISIPLYTIKSGDLTLPVSLSYHSSGNKVEEMASSVGLGWSLNAGGVITRAIRGKADEDINGFLNQTSTSQINTLLNSGTNLTPAQQQQLDHYLNLTADGTLDSEPDIYNYNFCGHSGQFVMDAQGNITVMPLENISFKFFIFSGQTTYIQSFTAKTPDGVTYYFGTDNAIEFTGASGSSASHAMSWYLYKITSPSFHEIDFTYTPESYDFATTSSQTLYQFVSTTGQSLGAPPNNLSQGNTNHFNAVKMSKITFENGSLQVFAATPRSDINSLHSSNGAKCVDTVLISSGNFNKLYKFYYLNKNTSRLRLDSLVGQLEPINGTNNYKKEKYSFTYSADPWSTNFAFLYSQDWWGYFNGKSNAYNGVNCLVPSAILGEGQSQMILPGVNRTTDENSMLKGMLTSITYPTGGYTNFTYEANTESNKDLGGTSSKFPVHQFSSLISNDPQYSYYYNTPTLSYYYNSSKNYNPTPSALITINGPPNTPVTVNITGNGLGTANPPPSPPAPLIDVIQASLYSVDSLGNKTGVYSVNTPSGSIDLMPGKYLLEVNDKNKEQGDSLLFVNYIKYTVIVYWSGHTAAEIQAMKNNYVAGGLRIQQIADYDGITLKPINTKTYKYVQPGTTYSSGWLVSLPVYSYTLGVERQVSSGLTVAQSWIDYSYARTSQSNYPLGTTQGEVIGYSHVEEFLGSNGENGKNEYFYTNAQTYPDLANPGGSSFPFAPPENYDSHRGLLLKETTWKNTGSGTFAKVNEKANAYTTIKFNVRNYGIKAGFNPQPANYSQTNSYYTNPYVYEFGRVVVSSYAINTDYNYLSSDTSRIYDQNDQTKYLQTVSNYQIDTSTYQVTQVQTTNSKKEKIIQNVTYPNDYNTFGSTGVAYLAANGITTYPIEEVTQKSNLDGTNLRTVKAVYTTYKLNQFFRDSVYEMRSVAGVPNFTMSTVGPKDSHYQPIVSFDKYDTYGNILQERKVGDAVHTYIWGYNNIVAPYNNTYPIAEVINADSASVAYTNFEQLKNMGTTWGNWVFNFAGITTDATAPMGSGCYLISGTNTLTKTGLNTASTYVVSFWAKSGTAITMIGGTVTNVATGNAKSGWIYHEYSVTGTTSVTIGGTGSVDEVRLYPSTAQMSTYTYVPLVGVASKCDVRNNVTYNVFDNVGRLIHVIDQNGNIVKDYNYHYQGNN